MYLAKAEFPQRYGGNIRVFMKSAPAPSRPAPDGEAEIDAHESSYGRDLLRLSTQIDLWRESKRAALAGEFRAHGKLRAKAFPARAAIPITLLKLDEEMIGAVHEKPGSPKIGHYVPGTRIPILSDDKIPASDPSTPLINLAWHIKPEIEAYLRNIGFRGRIIDIISQEDFISQDDISQDGFSQDDLAAGA